MTTKDFILDLGYKNLKFYQNNELYCFTSDAVMLANIVKTKRNDIVCDFCTGSSIIATIIATKNNFKKIYAIELQPEMYELAKKNIIINNLQNQIELQNDSIQNFSKNNNGLADVVVCNPPYKKQQSGLTNQNKIKAISRHEIALTIDELCKSISTTLKDGGRAYIVYDADRSVELVNQLKQVKLETKRIIFTQPSATKKASLILLEAVKGGKPGTIVMPVCITKDKDENFLDNFIKTYREE